MTGVQGLEEIEGFPAAHFSDENAVRAVAQRGAQEIANRHAWASVCRSSTTTPQVKYTFCPPKSTYETPSPDDTRQGVPLPPIADLIEQGNVIALNFPIAMNPGLARALGTMLKQDFQRAVLNRILTMAANPARPWRAVLFLCDEYQAFTTTGENEPSGDEKFFSLARQARCVPIVATQSISSLRSTLVGILAHAAAGAAHEGVSRVV